MRQARGKAATIVAGACVVAALVATPSAQAAVTVSHITTPTDLTYLMYNQNNPNTFEISGTSNGTTGDDVDIRCYDGATGNLVEGNVALNANGSFSVPSASVGSADTMTVCNLHAVPAGTTPADPTPFAGPRLLVGSKRSYNVDGGPSDGALYDYYLYFPQLAGGYDYKSLGSCGIYDGYLLDSNDALTTTTWYCNAGLLGQVDGTRSEVRVDGANAYAPTAAYHINPSATSGFPAVTRSYTVNPHTGDAVIHEKDPLVKCPKATYPPSDTTCAKFVKTGVTDMRTITQDHSGRVAWITDIFKSTDGHPHTLDLLWDNSQRFHPDPDPTGDSTQVEYEFPGQSSYSMHALNDSVNLPASAGTIFVRVHGAGDGDTSTGQGAIVYDRPATTAKFISVTPDAEDFVLHQTAKVPAKGSVRFRFAYVDDFYAAKVASLAKNATTVFKGCTVPRVAGKSLAAAKRAITHAHCTVGKISHAHSTTIAAGHVISSKPKAKTDVDYHAKVALVVSTG